MKKQPTVKRINFLTDYDLHLLCESTHYRAWEKLGAHPTEVDGVRGTHFAVWAPNAEAVSVIGDFNRWDPSSHPLPCLGDSGIWAGFVPGVDQGAVYKFDIRSRVDGYRAEKADPYAFCSELRPRSASIVFELDGYEWGDEEWMALRGGRNNRHAPMSIYEVHLGSWMRAEDGRWLSYRELAPRLVEYLERTGFTHIELLPISEHPFDGSWGYQTVGYYAPTSRFGSPHDFMYFVDTLHRHGIGVILDWVPSHFPKDGHGLAFFDGTHLYEHEDPRKGVHQDWDTLVFNYGRREVDNFLLANALYWLEVFHIDGLRVDAVASMLYLDYSREEGGWIPNKYGGRENLEAVDFLKRFNALVYERHPDVLTIAEESTAWPMVSRPTYVGGLGFGMKWNMGWMHDTLLYMSRDAVHRKHHHNDLTFSLLYAFHENFILALSHDEVVHGKRSLRCKMPGDEWQQYANMRLLFGYMWAHPGKKLLFMGGEFGAYSEWYHETGLEWHLLEEKRPAGLLHWVGDLNRLLRSEPALHDLDCEEPGFEWIDPNDSLHSTLSFVRWDRERHDPILCVCNFTPVPREDYRLGVPWGGNWDELLNSDSEIYGGSGIGNAGCVHAEPVPAHGRDYSVSLKLPPLSVLIFRKSRG